MGACVVFHSLIQGTHQLLVFLPPKLAQHIHQNIGPRGTLSQIISSANLVGL